ncbi:phosphoribosylformylglycinamidine cyclo-ligase [Alkalicoccus daliensis]|uniref:Phosphoribosylformylglycinamidine cyclo-ligase n=1 Tax=Alkalicoccus daliensis TaxID=745820 RepID=A0A1H0KJN9_9BACI|nr:phosphoribosylformylglycinamidine cyclo-ligase [Alkalicoccus daliensis]SDO56159.1 phosphoribosylformylglycinamidine cyclo-ligase [Alkalicoccus daliensis]
MAGAYEKAGVNIEAGYEGVKRMKKHVQSTMRPEVIGGLGGFGGLFDMSQLNLKEPVLVSGTDGVGTKLLIAQQTGIHDTIGIDAVAMCVNDIVAQGASPLFFLDYLALGKNDPALVEQIVAGVAAGCREADCALIGGETAEMPGLYEEEEYDVAGFVVGAAEKTAIWQQAEAGDVLIGLPSSGIHSNGFSLVRKIASDKGLTWEDKAPFNAAQTVAEALLTPTRIYVQALKGLLGTSLVRAAAHITGGGLVENVPRMLSEGAGAEIDLTKLPQLPVFSWLQQAGDLTQEDMLETFNTGVGMVLSVSLENQEKVMSVLKENGETPFLLGEVTNTGNLQFKGELTV